MNYKKEAPDQPALIHYNLLRKVLGWMGILFPVVLFAGSYIHGCDHIQDSISAYYYTRFIPVFCGVLFCMGLFFITYKGPEKIDDYATNLAGLLSFCIALFPTLMNDADRDICNSCLPSSSQTISYVHYGSATLFFFTLSCISCFLFTRSGGAATDEKKLRNKIYRGCGVVMFLCIALLGLDAFNVINLSHWLPAFLRPTFTFETISLWAFGTSWLVKGEAVFADGSRSYKLLSSIF
ncbi:MAG: hypothetical protein JWO06_1404 [Bacteroidota bacterium]|nr:hypothetical protein [Bacteroidota bacterium]